MVKEQILDTMKQHGFLENQMHIVVGLSGGPDSVCLFHVLSGEAKMRSWTLHPVHVNHKFRPGAAEEDQAYAEKLAEELGWHCETFVVDCNALAKAEKMTSEEAGRKARYDAFARVCAKIQKEGVPAKKICIVVAQNADDQAETILFRILRGAGTDGLAGILYERTDSEGNRIIRPLLDVKKKDILNYCKEKSLQPRMDHTNEQTVYTRNKIRLELIPYLEQEYNPSVKDTMIRMGKTAASDSDCLWQQALALYEKLTVKKETQEIILKGNALRDCHKAIRRRVLCKAFSELGLTEDFAWAHFENCDKILFHDGPSARCDLPKGFYFTKVYDDVKCGKSSEAGGLESAGEGRLPDFRMTVMGAEAYGRKEWKKDCHGAFDLALLQEALGQDAEKRLRIGFREPGDFIAIGKNQSKKIQDFFVDQKIPKDRRNRIPLLKIGHEVLWVLPAGYRSRFATKYKVSEATKKVICIEIICGI